MANDNRTVVSIVAVIAIVILVGLAIFFVMEEVEDDTVDIDIGLVNSPAVVDHEIEVQTPERHFVV